MQPVKGPVSQMFGVNKHFSWQPWGHLGKDYAVVIGTGCVAIAPGVVVWADWGAKLPKHLAALFTMIYGSPASGIVVIIQHDGWYSVYAHLDSTHLYSKTLTRKASVVARGDKVGESGNTGNSTGPHLHFEVFRTDGAYPGTFGRYDPDWQIAHEDTNAGGGITLAADTITTTTGELFTVSQYNSLKADLAAVRKDQANIKSMLGSPGGFTWDGKHHYSLWHVLAETQRRVTVLPSKVWAFPILNRLLKKTEPAEALLGSNEARVIAELSSANAGLLAAVRTLAADAKVDVDTLVTAVEDASRRGSELGSHTGTSAAIKSIDTQVTVRKEA